MPENNKTEEFLQKLTPCIEHGNLEACVDEAARVAREMGIEADELLKLSFNEATEKNNSSLAYVLALAAEQGLFGREKYRAYVIAGYTAQLIEKPEKAEQLYKKAIDLNPNDSSAYFLIGILLHQQKRISEAEEHYEKAIKNDFLNPITHAFYSMVLIESNKIEESRREIIVATFLARKVQDVLFNIIKASIYERYSEINFKRKKYRESSKDASKACEEYLNAAKNADVDLKDKLTLQGRVLKAKSFVRKVPVKSRYKKILYKVSNNSDISELIDNLKNAALWYGKASLCSFSENQEVCNACHTTISVFSNVLSAMSAFIKGDCASINKYEWLSSLEHAREIYAKKNLKNGIALIDTLKQLIHCVDELAEHSAIGLHIQEERLGKCYKNLIEVSEKLEGALKIISEHAVDAIRDYAKEQGMIFVGEEKPKESLWDGKLIKAVLAILTIIAAIIALLQFTHLDLKALDFIKSLLLRLGF